MLKSKLVRFLFLASLLFGGSTCMLAQNTGAPSIQICGGVQVACLDADILDLCVTVNIPADYPETIDSMEIEWGDGSTPLTIYTPGASFNRNYAYDYSNFFNTCTYELSDRFVTLSTFIPTSPDPIRSIFPLTVRNPPIPRFSNFPETVCLGQEINFSDNSCPTTNLTTEYDFGNGFTSESTHTFTSTGMFPVRLRAGNPCDTVETTRTLEVISAPLAIAVADSNLTTTSTDPYQVCIDGSTTIRINGQASLGLDQVSWEVSPSGGVSLEDRFNELTRATFSSAGTYRFIYRGTNNSCNVTVRDTFFVDVLATSLLQLNEQPDGCVSVDYQPNPFVPAATYWLNDVITDFTSPVTLGAGDYIVKGFLPSDNPICLADTLRDTFTVAVEQIAVIDFQDTTILCDQAEAFTLAATPASGGIWMINNTPFNGNVDPGSLGGGTYRITYGNDPCVAEDEITITIISSAGSGPDDDELCLDSPPKDYTALVSPPGGDFFIDGVPFDGIFNPADRGLGDFAITYEYDGGENTMVSCSDSLGFNVSVSELSAAFETGDCEGDRVCFVIPPGATFEIVSWAFGNLGNSTDENPCFTFPGPGTYTVTLTITNGPCTATAAQEIVIAPAPAPAFTLTDPDPLNCSELLVTINNNSVAASGLVYDWQLNGITFSDQPNPTPLALTAITQDTTYEITLSLSNACITRTVTDNITVRPLPIATFGTNKDVYCSQEEIELSNPAIGQTNSTTWTLNGEVIGTDSMPPLLSHFTEIGDTIEICQIAENDCDRDTLCRNIRIIPTTVEAFYNYAPSTVCAGDSMRVTNFATQGVDVIYLVSDGRVFTGSNPVIPFDVPGEYTVTQRAFGCGSDDYPQTIRVIESPVAAFPNPGFACPGESVSFNSTSSGDLRYSWNFDDGTPPIQASETQHRFATSGSYSVCLTVTTLTPDACDNTICQTLVINEAPEASFSVTDSVCLNEMTFVASTSTASVNILNHQFLFGDGNIAGMAMAENTYPAPGPYVITHIITDANQCKDTVSGSTFILPLPSPGFSFRTMDACNPDSVNFVNTTPDADSYLWDFGDGTSSAETAPTHTYDSPGTYEVSLEAFINGVCSATVSQRITINEMPVANIAAAGEEVCLGQTILFSDISSGSTTDRRWDFGDGTFSFDENPEHEFLAPGPYTVKLWVGNDGLCSDSITLDVFVNPPVLAAFDQVENISCNGENTGILSVNASSGTPPFSYAWSNGVNTRSNPGVGAGSYTVTVTDDKGCQAEESASLTEPERIEAAPTVSIVTCAGGADGTITVNTTGGVAPYFVRWAGGDATGTLTGLAAGNYPLTITDANNCEVVREVVVPENPALLVTAEATDISCFGAHDGVLRLLDLTGGVSPYRIGLTGEGIAEAGVGITRFDSLGPGVYSFEITDDVGCILEREYEWTEPAPAEINIIPDSLEINLGEEVSLDTRFNASEPVFEWFPAEWLDCTDCSTPVARPCVSRTYGVLLTDQRGCTDRDEVFIRVNINRDAWLPNTFTPNGDGTNDVFRVRSKFTDGIDNIESFRVYSSWDELLFEALDFPPNDRAFGWDGTYKGKRLAPDEFLYVAVVRYKDGEVIKLVGSVSLIR